MIHVQHLRLPGTKHRDHAEHRLQELVERSLSDQWRGRGWWWKTHPDEFEGAGQPDLVGHLEGKLVALELKVWPNRPSPQQLTWLRKCNATGACGWVLYWRRRKNTEATDAYYLLLSSHLSPPFTLTAEPTWFPLQLLPCNPPQLNLRDLPTYILASRSYKP